MSRELSEADRDFVADEANWIDGPTFAFRWFHSDEDGASDLLLALEHDPEVSWHALDDLSWVQREFADSLPFVWMPEGLPAVGLCVNPNARGDREQHMWMYPPHVGRAAGRREFGNKCGRDPKTRQFLRACVSLINRVCAECPIRAVVLADEVEFADPVDGHIVLWPPVRGIRTTDGGWSCVKFGESL